MTNNNVQSINPVPMAGTGPRSRVPTLQSTASGHASGPKSCTVLRSGTGLSIGGVSRLAGVSQVTLRYWEKLGLIQPERSEGGHRFYTEDLLPVIARLKIMIQGEGLKARDVALMSPEVMQKAV